jgi:hypothetical protein
VRVGNLFKEVPMRKQIKEAIIEAIKTALEFKNIKLTDDEIKQIALKIDDKLKFIDSDIIA